MKKIILYVIPVLFLLSCDPEEEVVNPSCNPEVDQANINNALNTIPSCLNEIDQGETMELINYFVEFNNGESTELFSTEELESWAQDIETLLTNNIINTPIDNNGEWVGDDYYFNFDQNTGTYSWNPNTSTYDVSTGSIIEINFPSSPDQNINNATFRMFNYVDYDYDDPESNDMIGVPIAMSCELEVDNEIILTINHSVSFNDSFIVDNYEIPSSINVSIFINPISIELQASRVNPYMFDAGFSINSSSCDISVSGQTQLLTTNYQDILTSDNDEWMSEIDYISIGVTIDNMTIEGQMNCQTLYDLTAGADDEITINEFNTSTDVDVLYQNQTVGTLELVNYDSDNDAEGCEIVYCDNSQESVVNYINPLMNSIESILYPYAGYWFDELSPNFEEN